MIRVRVDRVQFEPEAKQFKVVLREEDGERVLPIWVGIFEGNAIAMGLEHVYTPRPLTHDLMANVLAELGVRLQRVVVCDLVANTYYAHLYLERDGVELVIDARPSDAIALALRTEAPIYVADKLSDKMIDEFDELLSRLSPDDTVH